MYKLNKEQLELSEEKLEQVSGGIIIGEYEDDLGRMNHANSDDSQRDIC